MPQNDGQREELNKQVEGEEMETTEIQRPFPYNPREDDGRFSQSTLQ